MAVFNVPTRLAFQTILVATDFSASSRAALACAGAIARKAHGKVVLAHVISPERWHFVNPQELHPALCQTRQTAQKKMCSLLRTADLRGIEVDTFLKEGELREVLCKLAHERSAELLVVGTRGRKWLGKLLFGSTAKEVCRVAPCPILLVGPKVAKQESKIERILFPTDLSAPSLGALPVVLALAEQHEARLRFVRVVGEDGLDGGREFALKQLQNEFGPLLTQRTNLAHQPEFAIEIGPAAAAIRRTTDEFQADLIAMGTHRPGTLESHLPGDLVYDIVSDARCPVLTIFD